MVGAGGLGMEDSPCVPVNVECASVAVRQEGEPQSDNGSVTEPGLGGRQKEKGPKSIDHHVSLTDVDLSVCLSVSDNRPVINKELQGPSIYANDVVRGVGLMHEKAVDIFRPATCAKDECSNAKMESRRACDKDTGICTIEEHRPNSCLMADGFNVTKDEHHCANASSCTCFMGEKVLHVCKKDEGNSGCFMGDRDHNVSQKDGCSSVSEMKLLGSKGEDPSDSIVENLLVRRDEYNDVCVSEENGPSAYSKDKGIGVCTINERPVLRLRDVDIRVGVMQDCQAGSSVKDGGQSVCNMDKDGACALLSAGETGVSLMESEGQSTCTMENCDSSACVSKVEPSSCVKEKGHPDCIRDDKVSYEGSTDVVMEGNITNTHVGKGRSTCATKKISSSFVKTLSKKGENCRGKRKHKTIVGMLLKQQMCSTFMGEEAGSGMIEGSNYEVPDCMIKNCRSTVIAEDARPINFIVDETGQNLSCDTPDSVVQDVMETLCVSAIEKAALQNSAAAETVCKLKARNQLSKATSVIRGTRREVESSLSCGLVCKKPTIVDEDDSSGHCCICSNDQSWPNNLLVYCDGESGCDVAVHQGCYGIVKVPAGPWFCRKCESPERAATLKCELCPGKVGAFKRTDNGGWAHVVCALYIPEVSFACTTTMEPILLSAIPPDRFNKVCYICNFEGRDSKGACMTCNAPKCGKAFHATCAQSAGLLCAEKGSGSVTLKYCGYCKEHFIQLGLFAKDGKKKTIRRNQEEKQKFKITKTGVKKQSKLHPSLDTNVVHRRFKCSEDTAYQKSTVELKGVYSSGMDESVKRTSSVSKRKRKASGSTSEQHNLETGGGTIIKGKKVKLAVSTVNEELVNKCKVPKQKSKQTRPPKKISCVPSRRMVCSTSCVKGAALQKMLSAMTGNNNSQAPKDASEDNPLKAEPKHRRQRNRSKNAQNGQKLFRGKAKAEISKNSTLKIASKHQCIPAVQKAQRLPKDANLQESHPAIPGLLQQLPSNVDSPVSCTIGSSQNESVPAVLLKKAARKRSRILVSSQAKIPRKALANTIHPQKPRVKGVNVQKVSHAVDLSVSPNLNQSMKNGNLQISPPSIPATVISENMTVEVPILQKLSPTNQKDVRIQKLRLHISSLKSHRPRNKEPAVKPKNASSPASTVSQPAASGNDDGELSCKNRVFPSGHLLPEDCVSSTSLGDTANNFLQDSVSIEQLLERQWSEGQEFLLEHGTFSELLELLSSLSQLQMENDQLEQKIRCLAVEKERLQLMKCQLSFPLPARTLSHASLPRDIGLSAHGGCQNRKFAEFTNR